MKIAHHKTLWIHTVFSVVVCALLGAIVWLRDSVPTMVVAAAIALYVIGNMFIHIKRDDFKQETFIEYVLLGGAIFIVLVSALG